jgi:hypothetical protein
MAEEKSKKPKIDLKARLNKGGGGGAVSAAPGITAVPTGGPAFGSGPPPSGAPVGMSGSSGAPAPAVSRPPLGIAPPPGMSPGIPLPPFGRQAPRAEPKPVAQQQTIKVEVGEEVHQERKAASKKAVMFAAIGAVVGGVLGFVWGGAKTKGDQANVAIRGAGDLVTEIKAANEKMVDLNAKLTAAGDKLGNKQFPDELTNELAAINIDFDGTKLVGKGIGNMPSAVLKSIFNYTTQVDDLNKTKTSLRNLLVIAKAPIEKSWAEEKEPVANFSVIFSGKGEGKTMAELVPNKEPFPIGKDWPGSYQVTKLERTSAGAKGVEKKATRWTKGELTGNEPLAIPVDPATTAAFTSQEVINKLSKGMRDIRQIMDGNKDNPQEETSGLLKEGDDLVQELMKVSRAK